MDVNTKWDEFSDIIESAVSQFVPQEYSKSRIDSEPITAFVWLKKLQANKARGNSRQTILSEPLFDTFLPW